jgi:hypothetical protein
MAGVSRHTTLGLFMYALTSSGLLYFLLNYREHVESDIQGAGVAEVCVDVDQHSGQPVPRATRLCRWWWDGKTEPWYGDCCSVRFNGFVYALGHKNENPWVYVARVPEREAFNLEAYEYWNGTGWQRERLIGGLGEKESIMWQTGQGQIFWSEYHGCLCFVYCDAWWTDQVLVGRHEPCSVVYPADLSSRSARQSARRARGRRLRRCTRRNGIDLMGVYMLQRPIHTSIRVVRRWSSHIPTCQRLSRLSKS